MDGNVGNTKLLYLTDLKKELLKRILYGNNFCHICVCFLVFCDIYIT
jgi:hypothetical protein